MRVQLINDQRVGAADTKPTMVGNDDVDAPAAAAKRRPPVQERSRPPPKAGREIGRQRCLSRSHLRVRHA